MKTLKHIRYRVTGKVGIGLNSRGIFRESNMSSRSRGIDSRRWQLEKAMMDGEGMADPAFFVEYGRLGRLFEFRGFNGVIKKRR